MNKDQIFEKILLEKREQILHRLNLIEKDKRRTVRPEGGAMDEQATEIFNDEVLEALDEQGRAELKSIQLSLQKIKDGQYGLCENCGDSIKESRLNALPYTTLCIKCASELG